MRISVNKNEFDNNVCQMQLQRVFQELPGISEKDAKEKVANDIIKHVLLREYATKEIHSVPQNQIQQQYNHIKSTFPSEQEFQKMLAGNRINEELLKNNIADDIRVNMFIRNLAKNIPPAPKKVIEEFYKREYKASMKPKEIKAAHIVKSFTPNSANKVYREMCAIRKKLFDGMDFSELANKYSNCNDKNGDLGWFTRGKMVEEFDVILFSMNPGEISPVFQTSFGYHIATVYEIKKEEKMELSECAEDIKEMIHGRMVNEILDQWLEKVKQKANIKIEY